MNLQAVLVRYVKAVSKQLERRNRQGRTEFTANEINAVRQYGLAAQQIQSLINQGPLPAEEFKQYEYVPQHLRFSPKEVVSE